MFLEALASGESALKMSAAVSSARSVFRERELDENAELQVKSQPNPTQPATQPNPTQPNPTQPNPTQSSTTNRKKEIPNEIKEGTYMLR